MRRWLRTSDMAQGPVPGSSRERWALVEDGRETAAYDLEVRWHKPTDLRRLKAAPLAELRSCAGELRSAAERMYASALASVRLDRCPCCGWAVDGEAVCMAVNAVEHARCGQCGHVFVLIRPERAVLAGELRESATLAAPYVDKASCEERLAHVVAPKLSWLQEVFQGCHGRAAASVVDVGAGGGHFLEMARRAGMTGEGFELSEDSRRFASAAFGLELRGEDFLDAAPPKDPVDCVCFWGSLEYAPEPRDFLKAARRWLRPDDGLLVLDLPRYQCLGTAVLENFPDTVYRHMEPTSHVHCFSDASAATLLHEAGFAPVAAWYFGMDIHELMTQMALELDAPAFLERFARLAGPLQAALDAGRCCDEVVLAARPRR